MSQAQHTSPATPLRVLEERDAIWDRLIALLDVSVVVYVGLTALYLATGPIDAGLLGPSGSPTDRRCRAPADFPQGDRLARLQIQLRRPRRLRGAGAAATRSRPGRSGVLLQRLVRSGQRPRATHQSRVVRLTLPEVESLQNRQEASREALTIEEGSLYPALNRMLVKGWVSAEWGVSENNRKARFYRLTASGRKQLEKEGARFERTIRAIQLVMRTA